MSDIPLARKFLAAALGVGHAREKDIWVRRALKLMHRERPDFVAPPEIAPLSPDQRSKARLMRRTGMPINDIARRLGTNIGRVSEALHE